MKKLMVGFMLVAGLLAMAGPAAAQYADPLGLIASGAVSPFWSNGSNLSFIEIASPVGCNDGSDSTCPYPLHFIFYNDACSRLASYPVALTTNDVYLFEPRLDIDPVLLNVNGIYLVGSTADGFSLRPLGQPIHLRTLWFNVAEDFGRMVDPIAVDSGEPIGVATWLRMRTAATFWAPQETSITKTTLYFVCPPATVIGGYTRDQNGAFVGPVGGAWGGTVPYLYPPAPTVFATAPPISETLGGLVYDEDEGLLRDWATTCTCLTTKKVTDLSSIYAATGTYTEVRGAGGTNGPVTTADRSFAGYRAIVLKDPFFLGGQIEVFGALSNGSKPSIINGVITTTR